MISRKNAALPKNGRRTLLAVLNRATLRAVLTAVLLAGLANVMIGIVLLRMYMINNLELVGQSVADTVEAAVVFGDREAAEEALAKIGSANGLTAIHLVSPAGQVIAAWERHRGPVDLTAAQWIVSGILPQPMVVPMFKGKKQIAEIRLRGYGEVMLRFLLMSLLVGVVAFAASTIMAYEMSRRAGRKIVRPLEELAAVAHEARVERAFHRRIPPAAIEELHSLGDDFNALLAELQSWQEQLQLENEKLTYQANHDPLTGLYNRHAFEQKLNSRIERARRNGERLALFFMDGDKFKEVNDQLGHEVGDQVLQGIAGRLRSVLREGDVVARLGGDEFAVVLSPVREPGHALKVAENIVGRMAAPLELPSGHIRESLLSIGVAFFPDHADDATELLKCADMAMYRAKKTRPGSYVLAPEAMNFPIYNHN